MTQLSPHRGAPPGNTNALKHGFYSHTFQDLETSDLAGLDPTGLVHEIQLLRVCIRRVSQQGKQVTNLPESMTLLTVISRATLSLAVLVRTQRAITAAVRHREFQDLITQANAEIQHGNSLTARLSQDPTALSFEEEDEPCTSPDDCPACSNRQTCADCPPELLTEVVAVHPQPDLLAPEPLAEGSTPELLAEVPTPEPLAEVPAPASSKIGQAGLLSRPNSARLHQSLLLAIATLDKLEAKAHPPPGKPHPGLSP